MATWTLQLGWIDSIIKENILICSVTLSLSLLHLFAYEIFFQCKKHLFVLDYFFIPKWSNWALWNLERRSKQETRDGWWLHLVGVKLIMGQIGSGQRKSQYFLFGPNPARSNHRAGYFGPNSPDMWSGRVKSKYLFIIFRLGWFFSDKSGRVCWVTRWWSGMVGDEHSSSFGCLGIQHICQPPMQQDLHN